MNETIFDRIVRGDLSSFRIWEDKNHLAFLTPYPNTPGLTVVIPKSNTGDYVFSLTDEQYADLMSATKEVAKLLEKALEVQRIALVFEGTGVAYVHAKLIPLYGELANQTNVWSDHTEFNKEYRGYITTAEGPKMNDEELRTIQRKIELAGNI